MMDIRDSFKLFSATHARSGASIHTIRAYLGDSKSFLAWLRSSEFQSQSVGKDALGAWIESQYAQEMAPKTIRRRVASLRSILQWLVEQGHLIQNPFNEMKIRIPIPRSLPKHLSSQEIHRILQQAKRIATERAWITDKSFWLGLEILYSTGIRVSELCGIRLEDWDSQTGRIYIRGKGSRDRVVFIIDTQVLSSMASFISERLGWNSRTTCLLIRNGGQALTPDLIRRRLHLAAVNANVLRRVTPHMIRHTAATHLLEAGIDIRYVQSLLGHSSIAVTEIYTHVSSQTLLQNLQKANHRQLLRNFSLLNP